MNAIRLAVLAIALAVGYWIGGNAQKIETMAAKNELQSYRAEVARENEKRANAEAARLGAMNEALKNAQAKYDENLQWLNAENDRLADRVRAERLRVCAQKTTSQAGSGDASGDTAADWLFLDGVGADLVRLAREADQVTERARRCEGGKQ